MKKRANPENVDIIKVYKFETIIGTIKYKGKIY